MKIVSAAEMREIDRATSERFGVPSLTLMENAGGAVAGFVLSRFPNARRIGVVCGKGNNGGDGFVAARQLHAAGREVKVLLLCEPAELRGDAAENFTQLKIAPVVVQNPADLDSDAAQAVLQSDLLLDAVLGTGFHPPVSELYAAAITRMNSATATVVAVDIPSGAEADSTSAPSAVVARADAVVTFTAPRPAHIFAPLTEGSTLIVPIGSPPEALTSTLNLNLITPAEVAPLIAPRKAASHKGTFGHVLVLGGSTGKAGSVAMAGMAALRVGAGLSTVGTPKSVLPTVAGFHAEVMTEPLEETEIGSISLRALGYGHVDALAKDKTVLAVGPGISRHNETAEFVRTVVKKFKTPMVLDADG
ncbi:MAG TPA: NAD(P)H-hydrate epimerase, partial [Terriglobales bacterium]|nr:NAD(P)H-hydrate epimerase [Terriglobales bacterium]